MSFLRSGTEVVCHSMAEAGMACNSDTLEPCVAAVVEGIGEHNARAVSFETPRLALRPYPRQARQQLHGVGPVYAAQPADGDGYSSCRLGVLK